MMIIPVSTIAMTDTIHRLCIFMELPAPGRQMLGVFFYNFFEYKSALPRMIFSGIICAYGNQKHRNYRTRRSWQDCFD